MSVINGMSSTIEKRPSTISSPSSFPKRLLIAALALTGAACAAGLALRQLGWIAHVWDPFFGTGSDRVVTSWVSHLLPIPDAALGVGAYVLEAALDLTGGTGRWQRHRRLVLTFGLLVLTLGLAAIGLILIQALVLRTWCTWCLLSAIASLVIVPLALPEIRAAWRNQYDVR